MSSEEEDIDVILPDSPFLPARSEREAHFLAVQNGAPPQLGEVVTFDPSPTEVPYNLTAVKDEQIPDGKDPETGVQLYTRRMIQTLDLSHVKIMPKVFWKDEDSKTAAIDQVRKANDRQKELMGKGHRQRLANLPGVRNFTKEPDEATQLGVELFESTEDIDHLNRPQP
jgi:hypothetical protein